MYFRFYISQVVLLFLGLDQKLVVHVLLHSNAPQGRFNTPHQFSAFALPEIESNISNQNVAVPSFSSRYSLKDNRVILNCSYKKNR